MDLFLWKLIPQLIYPLAFCLWLAIISGLLVFWRKKLAVAILFVSMGILWMSSMPAFSSYLIASLERSFLPIPVAESPSADAIVILGGCIGAADYPRVDVDLSDAADRVLHATRLYRSGKSPIVIATGGTIKWRGSKTPEADSISRLLQEWGVPAHAIIMEPGSLNTYQNALNTKRLLDRRGLKSILLVTSAIHMKRALATFRSAGINAIPSPTDYGVVDREEVTIIDFLPDAGALAGTTQAIKEYMGLVVYRWRGWIKGIEQRAKSIEQSVWGILHRV
jgi:uncharacterized SAM-binding protein YcdF (DUF218 family)